mmetsp:Transcript_69441/g.104770  ORF Transcript_69441/g.104770 Transcript_69441/m.104770 type:complete len:391 (-) Transcript_69441:64-1236(-)
MKLLLLLLATASNIKWTVNAQPPPLEVGQSFCVEGFVMDFFCINRGTLLDNPSVVSLEEPERHSVHCLIDVASCNSSPYEVLVDPNDSIGGGLYTRGWRLTPATQALAIAEAQAVGICDDCQNTGDLEFGFRAVMDATIVDLGVPGETPITIDATQIVASVGVENPCWAFFGLPNVLDSVDPAEFAIAGGGGLRPVILAHGSLMMIAWGLLLPSGVIIAKFLKHRPDGLWFRIHKPLQITGLIIALTGWIIALVNFNVFGDKGYTNYYHGVMGCTVMTIGLLQPINAFFRPHAPEPGEETPLPRLLWEVLHKSMGWIAVLLAVGTISLGTTLLPMLEDQKRYQLTYGIGCGGALLILIIYIVVDKANFRGKEGHMPVRTHDDMEGRRYHS